MIESVQSFDLRDHLFTAGIVEEGAKSGTPKNALSVQSREGLNIGLAVTVRYRLDPTSWIAYSAYAAAGGQGTGAPGSGQCMARTDSGLYRTGDIQFQARRGARQSIGDHYPQAERDGIFVEGWVMLSDIQLPGRSPRGWKACC